MRLRGIEVGMNGITRRDAWGLWDRSRKKEERKTLEKVV